MSFMSWMRNRLSIRPSDRPATSRPAARLRPQLEALDDRLVPSALTVTNNLDSGKGSLRYEIAHASRNDTIVFAPSLDGQTITLTTGELDITKGLTIQGPGAGQVTIRGGNNSRVFEVNASAPVLLSGLTITHGEAVQSVNPPYWAEGGGILNLSTLTLSGCIVSDNAANAPAPSYGGGIYNAGTLTISGCTVSNNEAIPDFAPAYGGGIYNAGTLTITNSILSGNIARDPGSEGDPGSAVYNVGKLTVSSSAFYSNIPDVIYGTYTDGGGNTFGPLPSR